MFSYPATSAKLLKDYDSHEDVITTKYHLKLFVANMENFEITEELYKNAVEVHNKNCLDFHPDAGFDLFVPDFIELKGQDFIKLDLHVKASMTEQSWDVLGEHASCFLKKPSAYYIYPRSSIYKTPLRLANSTGIIDSGYRGNLMALFDVRSYSVPTTTEIINPYSRLVQICSPDLSAFTVELVDSEDALGDTTRGSGGLGSTGV